MPHARRPLLWMGCGVVGLVTLAACVVWYAQSRTELAQADSARLDAAALTVAHLIEDRLGEMRLRLSVAGSAAAGDGEISVTRVPLDGSETVVPLGPLLAAAGSGPDLGRPGLTPPYRLDGQWYAAMVAAPDPRGTLAAVTPLSGLRMRIDEVARSHGVDVLVVSSSDRTWWTSPLDENSLNLPTDGLRPLAGQGDATASAPRFLAAWNDGQDVARRVLPDEGLTVYVRSARRSGAGQSLDYSVAGLILLTGAAGLFGCALVSRMWTGPAANGFALAAPHRTGSPDPPTRAHADGTGPAPAPGPIRGVPFVVYEAGPDASGSLVVQLHAIGEPGQLGLSADTDRLPVEAVLERVADEQRRDLEDYLIGRVHADDVPVWLDWDVDGKTATVLEHFPFRIPATEGRPAVVMGLLVRAEHQYDEWTRLDESAREANAANTRKSRFLARLSHEMRTPLNAIIGFAELMETETLGPIGTPRYKDYLIDIEASGRHLHELINDIIDISRVETGELDLSEAILSVRSELDACVRFIRERLDASKLELVFDVPDGLPKLRADPLRFRQIMLNLLSNAIKFTKPGGEIGLLARVTSDNTLRISVVDTGIGMDEAGLRRAIEPFGRVSDDKFGPTEGTGLGLPIARGLTALHGGQLEIESAPAAGTTVNVIFPTSRLIEAE